MNSKPKLSVILASAACLVALTASGETSTSGPKAVSGDGPSQSQGTGGNKSGGPGTQGNPAKPGSTIELAGTQYTVLSATTTSKLGGSFGEKCDGICVVVKLKLENKKNETKTFTDSMAKFVAKDGTSYDTTDKSVYLDHSLILQEMQPNLPHTGEIAFDVPPSAVKTGVIKIEDIFGDGAAYFKMAVK